MADEPTTDDVEAPDIPDTPPPVEDSGTQPPEDGTPAEQPEPDTNWEQRYKDLQSEYTRTSQEAAELRRAQTEQQYVKALADPDTQDTTWSSLVEQLGGEQEAREWAEERGFEFDDDESDDDDFRDPRVDQLLSEREQEKLSAQADAAEKEMESKLAQLASDKNVELDDETKNLLLDAALARAMQTGAEVPDVEGVFNQLLKRDEARIKQYRATKRDQPSPPVPGGSGTPNPSLGNVNDRIALANAVADEALAEP